MLQGAKRRHTDAASRVSEYSDVQHLSCRNIQERKVLRFLKKNQTATPHSTQVTLSDKEMLIGNGLLKINFPEERSQLDGISVMKHFHSAKTFPTLSLERVPAVSRRL